MGKQAVSHRVRAENASKLRVAQKGFTRAKALRELSNGGDFNSARYTEHQNYHVRERAWAMAGSMVPETHKERAALFETLSKGRTLAGKELLKQRLGIDVPGKEEKAA